MKNVAPSPPPADPYIASTKLIPELRSVAPVELQDRVPSYGSLKIAMYAGRVPYEKIGNRLVVRRTDLPAIAAAFGLAPQKSSTTA